MFCMKCGKVIPDAARFCPYCGSQAAGGPEQQAARNCPKCGHKVAAGLLFCDQCGNKMDQKPRLQSWNEAQPKPRPQTERMPQQTQEVPQARKAAETQSGSDVRVDMERPRPVTVSWYRGDVKVGVAKATGLLSVYADRLEYDKKLGSNSRALRWSGWPYRPAERRKTDRSFFICRISLRRAAAGIWELFPPWCCG